MQKCIQSVRVLIVQLTQVLVAIAMVAAATFWWEFVKMFKRTGLIASDKEIKSSF